MNRFGLHLPTPGLLRRFAGGAICLLALSIISAGTAHAAQPSDFGLQVTPSPLVETLTPGTNTTYEVQIRNTGSEAENLTAKLGSFSINNTTQKVALSDQLPSASNFVSITNPNFTVASGQIYTLRVNANTPASAGFSYAFTITIQRTQPLAAANGQTALNGSVVVFGLFNVNRPGATANFQIQAATTSSNVYQFLPVDFAVKLINTGNSIIQPSGNIYINRSPTDKTPITALALNPTQSYLLPGEVRTLTITWKDGFPVYDYPGDGSVKKQLQWDWGNIQNLRVGQYFASIVATYQVNGRDVPVTATVSFWVIPWVPLAIVAVILLILGIGVVSILRKTYQLSKKLRK